jgi:hypothetical protein
MMTSTNYLACSIKFIYLNRKRAGTHSSMLRGRCTCVGRSGQQRIPTASDGGSDGWASQVAPAVLLSRAKAGNGHETQVHIDAHAAQVHKHIYQACCKSAVLILESCTHGNII